MWSERLEADSRKSPFPRLLSRVLPLEKVEERPPGAHRTRARKAFAPQFCSKGEAKGVEQSGAKVVGGHRAVLDVSANFVGSLVDVTAADARAGKQRRETMRPVVPAGVALIHFDSRRSAEFANHRDQRAA